MKYFFLRHLVCPPMILSLSPHDPFFGDQAQSYIGQGLNPYFSTFFEKTLVINEVIKIKNRL